MLDEYILSSLDKKTIELQHRDKVPDHAYLIIVLFPCGFKLVV